MGWGYTFFLPFKKKIVAHKNVGWLRFEHGILPSGSDSRRRKAQLLISSAQFIDKSPGLETKEVDHLRSSRNKQSLEGFRQATWTKRQNTEKWSRDVQIRKSGSFQAKYSSPPHLMHCINLAGHINGRMTPEQYPHSLQHVLPPPTKPW